MTWQTEISVQISPQVWTPEATEIEITSWKCRRDVCLERDLHGLEM